MIQHSQEFERTVGFIRTATGYTELHSQFARNGWQYSTKPQGSRGPASPGNAPGQKRSTPANMFKATPGNVTTRAGADNFSLPNDTTVPIYDARGLDSLDFDAVLPKLAESLPLYTEGEIPYGSFIVVGYTMMIYRANSGNWTLGNNIHWVIVVGIPDHN
ncbi:hypothetical protein DFP72DRAFT_807768 [Ephemerocybe angulata]|uniref:Uncharacterized protein n=1 Tax=Ephemerocybe angulata TaxID=980116 RepID=A0A8H6M873_9AGAR|nr:hypothetical protein DFP72DRAFT_807768 [Tulosesus angulatus]